MARLSSDREDLLRDATALVPRIQLRCDLDGHAAEVFAGFREGRALSLFFDADPVYQFNSQGELRRAFVDSCLLKAERGKLVSLRTERTAEAVEMISHPLTTDELAGYEAEMNRRLDWLADFLASDRCEVVGQVPPKGDARERLQIWLADFRGLIVANSPQVR